MNLSVTIVLKTYRVRMIMTELYRQDPEVFRRNFFRADGLRMRE